uniref:transport inhibitor response 1-like protein n=1 Tax=Erigeron canadensis TaxID=72917 RepID=UPI001CB928D9|nr:transport inhibitor response 1-like protein [Erigeron canadensis]
MNTTEPTSAAAGTGTPKTGAGDYFTPYPDEVLENVLENVLVFLTCRKDRNAVALVCKSWYRAEAYTRSEVFIGNCYAISPNRVVDRFSRVKCLTLKGKPRFADFSLVPKNWGAYFSPWIMVMKTVYVNFLEKIFLKRMCVTDDDLAVLAHSFPNFKELVLFCCDGFGTSGLAEFVARCRRLRVLELIEDEVSDDDVDWISCFPGDGCTNLECLSFDCVESPINFEALEKLVARSPILKKLRLNGFVSVNQLYRLVIRAPQLTHLGTGSFSPLDQHQDDNHSEAKYVSAFEACKSIVGLSGFKDIAPEYLSAIVPVCANLTSLNLSYANIDAQQLKPVISHCHKLQVFWVLDSICDEGLQAVAETCKDLRELRVFPINATENTEGPVSDVGLLAISYGCRKLQSILYFCQQMTNSAVVAMSKNCPDLVVFRLCIIGRYRPDRLTGEPMDEGFGAIVKNCKKLTRLAVSGLLTDRAFGYIGQYGKLVRTLSVGFNGDSDNGLKYVLEGCSNLQKLEIRDSPFGDLALSSGLHHFYNMRFVWMSSCQVTQAGCQEVARQLPRLVVEIFRRDGEEGGERGNFVDTLYMYRSLDGPRSDAPRFVKIL